MTDDGGNGGTANAADVFSLLGNGTRLAILGRLHSETVDQPVPFSTLYDGIDLDDSAQFNYHLKQLVPRFVSKSEDGYELTAAGRRLAQAVAAGTYTDTPRVEPFALDGECYDCGERALRGSYGDERFRIECTACGETVLAVRVPPTVVRGREPAELVDAFERWSLSEVEQATRGLCPSCGGAVDRRIDEDVGSTLGFDAVPIFTCTVCGRLVVTSFGAIARRDPTVEAFHDRRGDSLEDHRYWEVVQYVTDDHVEVVSRDPWLVRVSFRAAGDACRVEIDGSLEVRRCEIVAGGAPDGA